MMRGMWTIAKLDLLLWRRMPIAVASALIPPIGMTILLIVLSISVTQQPVALVVNSNKPNAQYMKHIVAADTDAYIIHEVNAQKAQQLLKNQEVAAIITVPGNFDNEVFSDAAQLDLTLNNIDIDFSDDIRRAVDRSAAQFNAPQLGLAGELDDESNTTGGNMNQIIQPPQQNPYKIAIEEQNLRQTNVSFLNYQVIPAYILLIISVGLMGTALLCAQEVERGTSRYLVLSPISPWILIAGRILGGLLMSLIILTPTLLLGFLTGIIAPPLTHIPALLILFVTTGLCASGLGAALGSILRGPRLVAMASSVLATYLFFLGGGFTTIAFLPSWIQDISNFIPTRYAIDGMRQALFYPDLQGVSTDITVLLGTAVLSAIIGSFAVRRSWKK
jgi:ABC-2 type transport system permease protein